MKKKRLGEVLRERGHLNQILLDQRGKFQSLGIDLDAGAIEIGR